MTAEITAEVIKDVKLVNVFHTIDALLNHVGNAVKHAGEDIARSIENSDDEKANVFAEHLLGKLSEAMTSVNKLLQINSEGMKVTETRNGTHTPEQLAEIKAQVEQSDTMQNLLTIMQESPEQAMMRLLMKDIAESVDGSISPEELERIFNGD